jgi:uncharacterized protein
MMLAQLPEDSLDKGPRATKRGAERTCAATGSVRSTDEMIRFVVSPEGTAVPDLKQRLPGRGVWITATRSALDSAVARKAFARSFKREVRTAPDLATMTERLIERAALEGLAIAYKAGRIAAGFAKVESALAQGQVVALLHASDAARDGVRKLDATARRNSEDTRAIMVLNPFTSTQLDLALGRSNVVHAALLAGPESNAFLTRAARLERFRTGTVGPTAKTPEKWDRNG